MKINAAIPSNVTGASNGLRDRAERKQIAGANSAFPTLVARQRLADWLSLFVQESVKFGDQCCEFIVILFFLDQIQGCRGLT